MGGLGGLLEAPGGGFLGGATPAPRGAALPGGGCLGGATPGGAFLVAAIENGLVGGSGAGGAVVGLVVGFVVGFGKGWVGFGLTLPRAPGGGLDGGLTAAAVAGRVEVVVRASSSFSVLRNSAAAAFNAPSSLIISSFPTANF